MSHSPPAVTGYHPGYFRSAEAAGRYPWFEAKHIESGRYVNLEELHRFDVAAAFGVMGWLPVIQYRERTLPNLVKYFFANLEVEGNVHDEDDARNLRITSYVKGVRISFNIDELAALLEVPADGELVYCPPRAKGYLDESSRAGIAAQILMPGRVMSAPNLYPRPRLYCRIIQHNIVPQSGHYGEVSQLVQLITYSVVSRYPVCLPYLIMRVMITAATLGTTGNLPYGRLITVLLQRLGVSLQGEVPMEMNMTSDIDAEAIYKMQMDGLEFSDDELQAPPLPPRNPAARAAAAADVAEAAEAAAPAEAADTSDAEDTSGSEDDDDDTPMDDVPEPAPHHSPVVEPRPAVDPGPSERRPSVPAYRLADPTRSGTLRPSPVPRSARRTTSSAPSRTTSDLSARRHAEVMESQRDILVTLRGVMDTQRDILDAQRRIVQEQERQARSLRVTQDQVHWLRTVYERDYDIADSVPSRPATPP